MFSQYVAVVWISVFTFFVYFISHLFVNHHWNETLFTTLLLSSLVVMLMKEAYSQEKLQKAIYLMRSATQSDIERRHGIIQGFNKIKSSPSEQDYMESSMSHA